MTFSKLIFAISLIGLLSSGCSNNNYSAKEGASVTTPDGTNNNGSSNENEDSGKTEQEGETNFIFSANAKHTLLGGERQVINYDSENEVIEVLIPLPEKLSVVGATGNLPNHPEVTISLDVVRSALVISFPLKNYLNLVKNPTGLPNGRPLPGINGGEPPSFGFPLPLNDVDAYGYLAFDSLSLYMEFDWKLDFLSLKIPIKSGQDGGRIGQLYLLNAVNGFRSGLFLTLSLPDDLSVLIANAQ